MSKFKVIYFNGRGRAESVRLVLEASATPFEDVRIQVEDWAKKKGGMPYGVMPVLEVGGQKFSQSGALLRYVARETGMAGKTSLEEMRLDMIEEVITDMREAFMSAMTEKDMKVKKQKMAKAFEKAEVQLEHLEKEVDKTPGDFFAGQKMTYADLHMYAVCEGVLPLKNDFLKPHKKLHILFNKVAQHPNVANYLKNREKTDF